ncbi:MAG: hypothetical protein ACKPEA_10425, partial [Planctomycetota bacterium]
NQFFCEPNESIEQLGSPIVLMIPLLIALWVTRLRPRTTLVAGCLAAVVHAGVAVWVFFRSGSQPVVLPTILSYAVMIVLSAVAGSSAATDLLSLAREVREGRDRLACRRGRAASTTSAGPPNLPAPPVWPRPSRSRIGICARALVTPTSCAIAPCWNDIAVISARRCDGRRPPNPSTRIPTRC